MATKKKFVLAFIAYGVLAVLAWNTLSDEPIRVFNLNVKLRSGTLLILGLFFFRSALYFWRTKIIEGRIIEDQMEDRQTDSGSAD